MKLNLGCGYDSMEGWTNVDSDPMCNPDLCFDITEPDWPIESSTVTEVLANILNPPPIRFLVELITRVV